MPGWRVDLLATAAPDDPTSGLSRTVFELGRALAERGHSVRVLYPSDGRPAPPGPAGVEAVSVPLIGVSRRPFGRDIAIGRAASSLIRPDSDVVIGNDEKAGALQMPRAGGHRSVFGMFFHDVALHTFDTLRPLEPNGGVRQRVGNWLDRRALLRLESAALARADVVIVGSEANRALLGRYYAVPKDRIALLPLGVPAPLDVGTREAARAALRIPADAPVVAFVGRTPERQGLDLALAAFRRVRVFFPGARLLVAGSSPPAEPGVNGLGVVDEITKARVYRSADVFLFPARYEGFGLAPREAMRYGVATIVSSHVPLDGATAPADVRVVSDDDPGSYASELAELLADPATRREVGRLGQAYADTLSYEKMAERFETLFAPRVTGSPAGA
ncbi:MAG TPA: glycosyltransferase family 4 protein [Thermoplasmata archaeon]|jgi:glycosyltransferase involved in cell wall biosynthesis|nr:glycosyltransferase family 4 protein [Thermoplasmata archaeon]